ncbi:HTH domain-containing protein [Rubritalea marina]|uniref:HTH domain-containing protein n=1 Tax=Rubritalea marina TaxID=361055 RepID=UPI00037E186D|nr:HTH domain-containing protein [Rubritalea marina]
MNALEIAKSVLEAKGGFLHVNEIAKHAHEMELCSDDELKDLPKLLSSALSKEVKTKKPFFSRIKDGKGGFEQGVYRLKKSQRFPKHRWGES